MEWGADRSQVPEELLTAVLNRRYSVPVAITTRPADRPGQQAPQPGQEALQPAQQAPQPGQQGQRPGQQAQQPAQQANEPGQLAQPSGQEAQQEPQQETYSEPGRVEETKKQGPEPEQTRPRLAVVGAGDYGRAFATRAVASGYQVSLGSRHPERNRSLTERTGAAVCTVEDAVRKSDVAVICVPFAFYDQLPVTALSGKTLVDISNSTPQKLAPGIPSNAEDLQNMIPKSQVVKGFNVISAYALENNLQGGKKVFIASDFSDAKTTVATLIADMGFTASDMGSLVAARKIEKIPLQLFPSWTTAIIVTAVIFIFFWMYSLFKYQICTTIESDRPWEAEDFTSVLMVNFNKALAMSAITVLAATYLPGVLVAYLQLKRGTKYRRYPRWLNRWLLTRRQLGLAALMLALIHGVISITMSSPFYLAKAYDQPVILQAKVMAANSSHMQHVPVFNRIRQGRAELGLSVGATSICLLFVIGITSLPSVGGALSLREFRFVQSGVGWAALLTAVLHNALLGWDFMVRNYSCSVPSAQQVGIYLPAITVLLKLPLLVPAVSNHLALIQAGFERVGST